MHTVTSPWYDWDMYYSFKPNPKQLVVNKAKNLFGRDAKVNVTGSRPTVEDCTRLGVSSGTYFVECFVNGTSVARADAKNWRKAYGLLVVAVERAYESSLFTPTRDMV